MPDLSEQTPWKEPQFLTDSHIWIADELQRRGIQIIGRIEQPHVRPWSTVMQIPTDSGTVLFKATIVDWKYEAQLTKEISRLCPTQTPEVLAADTERNWLLMRDGGVSLRSVLKAKPDAAHWRRIMPLYARLQRSLIPNSSHLIEMGAADRRLATLPSHYAEILENTGALCVGEDGGLTRDEHRALKAKMLTFVSECERLSEFGIPGTLQHDDLHDNNILVNTLVNQSGGEPYLFFDWGDCCIGHPFFSLVVALRSVGWTLGADLADGDAETIRDSYLSGWTDILPLAELNAACDLALQVGIICRALTWYRLLPGIPEPHYSELAPYLASWMRNYLEEAPIESSRNQGRPTSRPVT